MWFTGQIGTAISTAKSEKRLLIIYIHGEDEDSKRVSAYWENEQIRDLVTQNSCIALKLLAGSEAAKHFAEIYPVVNIPISFFILPNGGVPLEMLVLYDSLEAFIEKLTNTIEAFKKAVASESGPESSSVPVAGIGLSSPGMELSVAGVSQGTTVSPSNSLQDRVDRAQELIRERQEKKAADDAENARLAELKRRQEGREFQLAQERLKEQEALKNALEQKKQKMDDKEHLKRLREQIAADRAEKAAQYNSVQNEQKKAAEEKKQQKAEKDEHEKQEEEERRRRYSVIQFRFPDNSSMRNQFEGTANFAEAEEWVSREANLVLNSFQLIQMLPRREFTALERTQSFAALGLTPNAVLMVLPDANSAKAGRRPKQAGSSTLSWLWEVVSAPVRYIVNALYAFIFGAAAAPRPVTGPSTNANNPAGLNQQQHQPSTSTGAGAGTSSGDRGTGTIARFRNLQDTQKKYDDDNATWNGNSTQQL